MHAFLTALLGHNRWATAILIRDARRLSAQQYEQRLEIGPGSVHDTLRHIVGAMRRWADRIGERPLRRSIEDERRTFSLAELNDLLDEADGHLREVAGEIESRGGWSETMEFRDGERVFRFTRATAMMHVLTHGVHHRAQILNMRRRLGLPALGLDLDVVEWECVETGQIVPPI